MDSHFLDPLYDSLHISPETEVAITEEQRDVSLCGMLFHSGCCIISAVTGICVSQGCVFPAHIFLGMRVSPHTYH